MKVSIIKDHLADTTDVSRFEGSLILFNPGFGKLLLATTSRTVTNRIVLEYGRYKTAFVNHDEISTNLAYGLNHLTAWTSARFDALSIAHRPGEFPMADEGKPGTTTA